MSFLHRIARLPLLGRALLAAYRFRLGLGYVLPPLGNLVSWTFRSRELFNYTYDLDPRNREHLAAFIANATGVNHSVVLGYFRELENDTELSQHLRTGVEKSSERFIADSTPRFGRRIGWYAFVRIRKPALVLETGVDKGLGACVLCAALLRNRAEGSPGRYLGTEINPRCGYLLHGPYAEVGRILFGDSLESLASLHETVDLFVNDSDHSADYEGREYQAIRRILSPDGIIIGDNAHATDELLNFCLGVGRSFSFFAEKPLHHWYPGAGIGLAGPAKGQR